MGEVARDRRHHGARLARGTAATGRARRRQFRAPKAIKADVTCMYVLRGGAEQQPEGAEGGLKQLDVERAVGLSDYNAANMGGAGREIALQREEVGESGSAS